MNHINNKLNSGINSLMKEKNAKKKDSQFSVSSVSDSSGEMEADKQSFISEKDIRRAVGFINEDMQKK